MTMVALAENKALREKIDGALNGDAATLGGAVNEASGIVQTLDGAKEGDISHITLYQGSETDNEMRNYAAAYDEYNNETYLNTEETDISRGGDIMKSIFWEAQRKKNADSNIGLDSEQQYTMASLRGGQAETLWNRFSETANKNSSSTGSWNTANSGYLSSGSIKANSLVTDTGNVVPRIINEPAMMLDGDGGKGGGGSVITKNKYFSDDKKNQAVEDEVNFRGQIKSHYGESGLNEYYDGTNEAAIEGYTTYSKYNPANWFKSKEEIFQEAMDEIKDKPETYKMGYAKALAAAYDLPEKAFINGAILGAFGGLGKGLAGASTEKVVVNKIEKETIDNSAVKYYRVQGGEGTNASRYRIDVLDNGQIKILNKESNLSISAENKEHANYFLNKRGGNADVVEFEVPKWFDSFIKENAVPQTNYKANSKNQSGMAPKIVDTKTPGVSYELPAPWVNWLEESGQNGRIIKKE